MSLVVHAPGSKSLTQRALLIAALADGPSQLHGALDCDDSRYLTAVLRALGIAVTWSGGTVNVSPAPLRGAANLPPLYCGNAGTTVRFCSALALITEGGFAIDGDARMRQRPIGPLGDALRQMGVRVTYLQDLGYPPLRLEREKAAPSQIAVDATLSSQFASGLMLIAPRLNQPLRICLTGNSVSRPYLTMTTDLMTNAGANVTWSDNHTIDIRPGSYRTTNLSPSFAVEPDWSGAAFLLAAAHLTQRDILIPGLATPEKSTQGDAAFSQMCTQYKQHTGPYTFDLTDTPDLIAPLAALALFAASETTISGAAHTRVKECDRIAVLTKAWRQLGATVEERPDGMTIYPLSPSQTPISSATIALDPHHDHRMAMAFGLAQLKYPQIQILHPECVSKSFPNFWDILKKFHG